MAFSGLTCGLFRKCHGLVSNFYCLFRESHGFFRNLMASSGISWLRQESHGYVRNLMATSGISWLRQESHGYVRNLMATPGISWLRQESHGYVRNLMATSGICQESHGFVRNLMAAAEAEDLRACRVLCLFPLDPNDFKHCVWSKGISFTTLFIIGTSSEFHLVPYPFPPWQQRWKTSRVVTNIRQAWQKWMA